MANCKLGQNLTPSSLVYHVRMRDLIVLLVHLITTVLRIARPGGLPSVVAESVLIRHSF
jgi:hypothetical protein